MLSTGLYTKEESVEELANGTYQILENLDPVNEEYEGTDILAFLDYIADWFDDLIRMLSSEGGLDGKYAQVLAGLAEFDRMIVPFDTYLNLFGDSLSGELRSEIINKTVELDNKPGFEALLRHWPDLIKAVRIYPTSDMEILDKMFASDVLVPGTDESFDAFNEFIERDCEYIDGKILLRILHNSYLSRTDRESNKITLSRIIRHTSSSPEELQELHRFIPSPEYINIQDINGRTALHYAAMQHLPLEVIQELIGRGADPAISDNDGNNLLHYIAKYYAQEDYEACTKLLPEEFQSARNNDGETPGDVFTAYERNIFL